MAAFITLWPALLTPAVHPGDACIARAPGGFRHRPSCQRDRPLGPSHAHAVLTAAVLAVRWRTRRRSSKGSLARESQRSKDVWRGALFSKTEKGGAALSLLPVMQDIYTRKILPLESRINLARLSQATALTEAYFYAKPLVTVIGQYSTGKSTLISELLGTEYPGVRIGPQPTTDNFVAVMAGSSRQVVPGFALCSDASKPFGQLQRFGRSFLERLQASLLPESEAPILKEICFIDTPGVLSGKKQRLSRNYDIEKAVGWFAENSDLVLVMLDPNKLDISDEFERCLAALNRNERKVRFILNKADQVNMGELVKVNGALMWSLSKVISAPEVVDVTIASFGRQKAAVEKKDPHLAKYIEAEEQKFMQEVLQVPFDNTTRKVNDLVRRARLARCHALLVDHLARKRGGFFSFGRNRRLQDIMSHPAALSQTCNEVARRHGVPVQDFLPVEDLCAGFKEIEIGSLKRVPPHLLAAVDEALRVDIPPLMDQVAAERDMHIKSAAEAWRSKDQPASA